MKLHFKGAIDSVLSHNHHIHNVAKLIWVLERVPKDTPVFFDCSPGFAFKISLSECSPDWLKLTLFSSDNPMHYLDPCCDLKELYSAGELLRVLREVINKTLQISKGGEVLVDVFFPVTVSTGHKQCRHVYAANVTDDFVLIRTHDDDISKLQMESD